MKRQTKKRVQYKRKNLIENAQTKNKRGNMAFFLTDTTLPMLAETRLLKLPKLPQVSQRLLQMIPMLLQQTE